MHWPARKRKKVSSTSTVSSTNAASPLSTGAPKKTIFGFKQTEKGNISILQKSTVSGTHIANTKLFRKTTVAQPTVGNVSIPETTEVVFTNPSINGSTTEVKTKTSIDVSEEFWATTESNTPGPKSSSRKPKQATTRVTVTSKRATSRFTSAPIEQTATTTVRLGIQRSTTVTTKRSPLPTAKEPDTATTERSTSTAESNSTSVVQTTATASLGIQGSTIVTSKGSSIKQTTGEPTTTTKRSTPAAESDTTSDRVTSDVGKQTTTTSTSKLTTRSTANDFEPLSRSTEAITTKDPSTAATTITEDSTTEKATTQPSTQKSTPESTTKTSTRTSSTSRSTESRTTTLKSTKITLPIVITKRTTIQRTTIGTALESFPPTASSTESRTTTALKSTKRTIPTQIAKSTTTPSRVTSAKPVSKSTLLVPPSASSTPIFDPLTSTDPVSRSESTTVPTVAFSTEGFRDDRMTTTEMVVPIRLEISYPWALLISSLLFFVILGLVLLLCILAARRLKLPLKAIFLGNLDLVDDAISTMTTTRATTITDGSSGTPGTGPQKSAKIEWLIPRRRLKEPLIVETGRNVQEHYECDPIFRAAIYQEQYVLVRAFDTSRIKWSALNRKSWMRQEVLDCKQAINSENVTKVFGVCKDLEATATVGGQIRKCGLILEFCYWGKLCDVLLDNINIVEWEMRERMVLDVAEGLLAIHRSAMKCHGSLRSTNCYVSSNWTVKIGIEFAHPLWCKKPTATRMSELSDEELYGSLVWTAPELLVELDDLEHGYADGHLEDVVHKLRKHRSHMIQQADVYSFGILAHEILEGKGPFPFSGLGMTGQKKKNSSSTTTTMTESIYGLGTALAMAIPRGMASRKSIVLGVMACNDVYHPNTTWQVLPTAVQRIRMQKCWSFEPAARPNLISLRQALSKLKRYEEITMCESLDQCVARLEERLKRREQIFKKVEEMPKDKMEAIIEALMPFPVARQLISTGGAPPSERFDSVTILFADIAGIGGLVHSLTAARIVRLLTEIFSVFDQSLENRRQRNEVYKVETIGDQYMVVSGLPIRNKNHAEIAARVGLNLLNRALQFPMPETFFPGKNYSIPLRVGLHTGPVVAGIVGHKVPYYRVIGDTVNYASRIQAYGYPSLVHASEATVKAIKAELPGCADFDIRERGIIEVKGKGPKRTYWILTPALVTKSRLQLLQKIHERDSRKIFKLDPTAGDLGLMEVKETEKTGKLDFEKIATANMIARFEEPTATNTLVAMSQYDKILNPIGNSRFSDLL